MTDDDFDVLPPDPLLSGSDGDEAPALVAASERRDRPWLGVAAGVGVGSAAIVAAMMYWGRKDRAPKPEPAGADRQSPSK